MAANWRRTRQRRDPSGRLQSWRSSLPFWAQQRISEPAARPFALLRVTNFGTLRSSWQEPLDASNCSPLRVHCQCYVAVSHLYSCAGNVVYSLPFRQCPDESASLVTTAASSPAQSYWARSKGPWRFAGFRWYWLGSFSQAVAQGMQFLVLGWLVLELTGSSIQQLGLVVFLYGIPNTILLPVGGVIADRIDRRLLLILTQAGVGVLIGAMAFLTVAGAVTLWHVYLAVALLGVLQALNQPARVTLLADIVGPAALLDAIAQFNAAVHIGRIIGPPLAGVLIDGPPLIAQHFNVWGLGAGLAANAVFYFLSVLCLLPIRGTFKAESVSREPLVQNFINGFSAIKNSPVLLTVIVLACSFGGFGMSHMQVIPAFAKDQLLADATQAGLILQAGGGIPDRQHRDHLYAPGMALPVAARVPSGDGCVPHPVWLDDIVLAVLDAVCGGGDIQPGLRVAAGHHHPAVVHAQRAAGTGDGRLPLHSRLSLHRGAAAVFRSRGGGLASGNHHRGRPDADGHCLVRPGTQGRTDAGIQTCVGVRGFGLIWPVLDTVSPSG